MADRTQVAAAVDALVLVPPTDVDRVLAVAFVRRVAGGDAGDVLAALGLDGDVPPVKCGTCGYKQTSRNHQVMCA